MRAVSFKVDMPDGRRDTSPHVQATYENGDASVGFTKRNAGTLSKLFRAHRPLNRRATQGSVPRH